MKTYLECFPCFVDQALRAGRLACDDEAKIKEILDAVGEHFSEIPMTNTPPETGVFIYGKVREITGVDDPYKELKRESIRQVLALYPKLESMVSQAADPLLMAIRLATIGNVLDFGIKQEYNLAEEVEQARDMDYAIYHYHEFREQLERVSSVLYIGDNAGESVFDRLLIGALGKKVTYVVREAPIINDVVRQDALDSRIGEIAEIVSSGSTAPGTILNLCNDDFLERFHSAELVISKGQGNYEGLSDAHRQVFFLLRAKCPVIARNMGVNLNDYVFLDSLRK